MIKLCFIILFLTNFHYFFTGNMAWYISEYCNYLALLTTLIFIFKISDNKNITGKSILAIFIILIIIDCIIYWPLVYKIVYLLNNSYIKTISIIYILSQLFITIPLFYYVSSRNYYYKSDKIDGDNIYFCLKKADTNRYIFTSVIGAPFGSISIFAKNNLYGFKWSKDYFLKRLVSQKALQHTYIIFDTGIKCTDKHVESLENLIGTTAKIKYLQVRFKCVYVLKDFLKILGEEYTPVFLEFIPSLFVKKIMGVKDG